jgi:hypothetical protein
MVLPRQALPWSLPETLRPPWALQSLPIGSYLGPVAFWGAKPWHPFRIRLLLEKPQSLSPQQAGCH